MAESLEGNRSTLPAQQEEILRGDYYSVKEVADKFGYTKGWINTLVQKGSIRAFKPLGTQWRIPRSVVQQMEQDGLPRMPRAPHPEEMARVQVPAESAGRVSPVKGGAGVAEEKKKPWFPIDFF